MHDAGIRFGVMIVLLLVGLSTCRGEGDGATSPKPGKAEPESAVGDRQQILGQWVCVKETENGKIIPNGNDRRAVFTDNEVKISNPKSGMAFRYHLDRSLQPNRCDLQMLPLELGMTLHAIYRLDGDQLTIAMPIRETLEQAHGQDPKYPASLEPGEGRAVAVYKRLGKRTGAAAGSEQPPRQQEAAALIELRKALADAAGVLGAGQMREFAQRYFLPLHPEMAANVAEIDPPSDSTLQRARSMAKIILIVASERPTFSSDYTRATFDLRLIHVDGAQGNPSLTWAKAGDQWCIDEK